MATGSRMVRVAAAALMLWMATASPAAGRAPAAPPHPDEPVQLFSAVDQEVVALGEPFVLTVEAYAAPRGDARARAFEASFEAALLALPPGAVELVRREPIERFVATDGAQPVLRLRRRFVLRAITTGRTPPPSLRLEHEGRTYSTGVDSLHVFRVEAPFFRAGRGIVPLVAEAGAADAPGDRTGTGFLVAPDALVTSYHVVMDARRVQLRLPGGRRITTRKAWAIDPEHDVAVLYVDPRAVAAAGLTPLEIAPDPTAGEEAPPEPVVFTNGWSDDLQRSTAGVYYPDLQLQRDEVLWISSNPVRPGNSGGPLLDRWGRVLGVVASGTGYRTADELREDMCIATDPRPALNRMAAVAAPRSLARLVRQPAVRAQPRAFLLRLSASLLRRGRSGPGIEHALQEIDENLGRRPDDPNLHYMRGALLDLRGTRNEAAEAYEDALGASATFFPAAYMLGLYALSREDYAAAEARFLQTRAYPPYRHLSAYGLALAHLGRRRYADALPYLHEVIRHDPTFAPALFDLARSYLALKDETRARQVGVKLNDLDSAWAVRLRQMLRFPALRPVTLVELPPVALAPVAQATR